MKKVVIIGGGIAGLTAGIYLQQAGFETEIYEKNQVAGGQCTGWNRDGFHIDNCIHWLTGAKNGSDLNTVWKTIGALNKKVKLVQMNEFYSVTQKGERLTLWSDLEKTRKEMIRLSPVDQVEIDKLIDYTKLCETMMVPVEKPFDMMNLFDLMKLGKEMSGITKVLKEYGKTNVQDLANRFHHPLLQHAINAYLPKDYQAFALLVTYATVTSGNGAIPKGGSFAMSLRIQKKYEDYGGKLLTNKVAEKVLVEGKRAKGVEFADHTIILSDYIVCACDTNYTFRKLLDYQYMPKDMQLIYKNREQYPVISGFQIAFAVDGVFQEISGTNFFPCKRFQIARETIEYMSIRNYDYETLFAPAGKCVIQCNFMQRETSYTYWENLYQKDHSKYIEEKNRIAKETLERIITQYSFLKGKIRILDVWTPFTYYRYCNSFHGSYMGFIISKNGKDQRTKGKMKGLKNVMLASQWQMGPGGLPVAAVMGKFSAQRIMKCEKMKVNKML